jgi:hypothetical protein
MPLFPFPKQVLICPSLFILLACIKHAVCVCSELGFNYIICSSIFRKQSSFPGITQWQPWMIHSTIRVIFCKEIKSLRNVQILSWSVLLFRSLVLYSALWQPAVGWVRGARGGLMDRAAPPGDAESWAWNRWRPGIVC